MQNENPIRFISALSMTNMFYTVHVSLGLSDFEMKGELRHDLGHVFSCKCKLCQYIDRRLIF